MHVVQRYRVNVILDLFAVRVGQSGKAAHRHPHGQILTLDIRR